MKKYSSIFLIVLGLLFGSYLLFNQPASDQTVSLTPTPSTTITYQGVEGKTALEVLKEKHTVKTKSFSFGEMVETINDIKPEDGYFWAFYVNGATAKEGASTYITRANDQIEWRLEKIE